MTCFSPLEYGQGDRMRFLDYLIKLRLFSRRALVSLSGVSFEETAAMNPTAARK